MDNNELSYEDWLKTLEGKSDEEISLAIKEQIINKSGMDEMNKKLFNDIYEYFANKINANKSIEIELLRIYLTDIKGYSTDVVNKIDFIQMLVLLNVCGIQTGKMTATENDKK